MRRRDLLLALPLGGGFVLACASSAGRVRAGGGYVELGVAGAAAPGPGGTGPDGAGKKGGTILVAMPDTAQTREVWTGLSDELGKEHHLVAMRVDGAGAGEAIAEGIRRHQPVGLVLMNNPTVAAYRAYQRAAGAARFPPAVIVMTSFLSGHVTQVASATGISYEVPLITVVTNLRKVIATPVERVGVIRRAPLHAFVERQAALARREQITVVEQEVSAEPNSSELGWALRRIKGQVDALWILNDDRLLSPRLIAEGWLPGLDERPFCPSIVGAASLVSSAQSFGTFAVLPDHAALGAQAAGLLYDIGESGWTIAPDAEVQLPLSTTTTVDLVQARRRFSLREDALRQVDHILDQQE
jgi:hypothetical protein